LDGVTISVEAGKTSALVGPSGSGKSTISDLVLRFYDPDSGAISVDSVPLTEVDASHLRRKIAVVQQEPFLFSGTIEENIRYGKFDATQEEVEEAARMANAHDFISNLREGYQTECGYGGSRLSGGQKQRIAIARAILRRPNILILDEATSALDVQSIQLVQDSLNRIKEEQNLTVLVIAHRISTIKDADRIFVLAQGRVVESGNHDQLLREGGVYASYFSKG